MEVINPRSALLSNYEVLALLRELESEHIARTKTALRIKKEEESAGVSGSAVKSNIDPVMDDISENLRTMEVEAIQYLTADFQPTASQTPEGIAQLLKDLHSYNLTKAEKLQVVNLAPTEPVELYVIVEEIEDRLGDRMPEILDCVRGTLSTRLPPEQSTSSTANAQRRAQGAREEAGFDQDGQEHVFDESELVFDDVGEGAGVEGDLEMEEE